MSKRIFIINFTMDTNSPVLGWQARVAYALAEQCEQVVVFTHSVGAYKPHPNLVVKQFRAKKHVAFLLAMADVWRAISAYKLNVCFIHMAHTWAYKLAPVFFARRIPVMLWYAHGHAPLSLRVADACVTKVVTSTASGYPLPSKKRTIIGQGIDADLFTPPIFAPERKNIVYFGRIAPRKCLDFLLDVFAQARQHPGLTDSHFDLFGPTMSEEDEVYKRALQDKINNLGLADRVTLHEPVTMTEIPALHAKAFLHLSASRTDSMDKTLLESLACGVAILTSNVAFKDMLEEYPEFIFHHNDSVDLVARKVIDIYLRRDSYGVETLRNLIVGKHDQKQYARKLLDVMDQMLA